MLGMDPEHLEELIRREPTYWWHVAKRALVLRQCHKVAPPPARVIEGGVGAGGNLSALKDLGYDVAGLDLSVAAIERCRRLGLSDSKVHDLEKAWPYPAGSARVVILLDVLEHLADPVAALTHAANVLEPKGELIVTVPALPILKGPWDDMLGHYRRYTRWLLIQQAKAAGFESRWISYWNSFTLPAAMIVRWRERLGRGARSAEFPDVPPLVNRALIELARAERGWQRFLPVPIGLSLCGVFRRVESP